MPLKKYSIVETVSYFACFTFNKTNENELRKLKAIQIGLSSELYIYSSLDIIEFTDTGIE